MTPLILHKNLLKTANSVVASSTAPGFSSLALMDERPYTYWKSANNNSQTITITLNSSEDVDCLGICAHNIKGCTVQLQAYSGGSWQTIGSIIAPEFSFMIKGNSINAQQFRVTISASTEAQFLGVLSIGKALVFPEKPNAPYVPFSESTEAETNISKTNNELGTDEKNNPVTCSPSFMDIQRTWVNSNFEPFWYETGKQGNWFFYGWDLDVCPDEVLYVKFAKGFNYSKNYKTTNYTDLSLSFEGRR